MASIDAISLPIEPPVYALPSTIQVTVYTVSSRIQAAVNSVTLAIQMSGKPMVAVVRGYTRTPVEIFVDLVALSI